ncbi:MAG: alanine--tRNA ligase [Nanoarchaeota archaeon]|nr:alanine--tRNA ligase [Nanoarchaeota archaeon]
MKAEELIKKYLEFFKKREHTIIRSAPLIPENDPTVLFTTAGMHPLVPYLLGQAHPGGKRLADVQKCIRTGDIEDVGDNTHSTFFEMLGNWSLGDYFKKESLTWSYEFLTNELKLDKSKLHVTVFAGDNDAPRDEESAKIWKSLGLPGSQIHYLPKEDNWWGPAGETGPCGPDSEIFVDTGKTACSKDCKPGCKCARFVEIWNNVFMQYNKTKDGKYEELKQKNIDTGMGVERTTTMMQGKKSVYETELFTPLFKVLEQDSNNISARIIVDHIKAATMMLGDEKGVLPGKSGQGYVLRRLIRRAVRYLEKLNIDKKKISDVSKEVIKMYKERYANLESKKDFIIKQLNKEVDNFYNTLSKGLSKFNQLIKDKCELTGEDAFLLYQSFGFPIEMIIEEAKNNDVGADITGFENELAKHQELSKAGADKLFKGGLADNSEETKKLHTATHLLLEALRRVLKSDVRQRGSNITAERLRFDFKFDRKLEPDELKKVEDLVNEQIKKALPVKKEEMTFEEAKKAGAQAEFEGKYKDKVFVYSIGDFSKEVCGGPHVSNTKELGSFRIKKEESIAAGVRRIKAVLE